MSIRSTLFAVCGAILVAGADSDAAPPKNVIEQKEWTNSRGQKMTAEVVSLVGETVTFKLADGRTVPYAIGDLTEADQIAIRQAAETFNGKPPVGKAGGGRGQAGGDNGNESTIPADAAQTTGAEPGEERVRGKEDESEWKESIAAIKGIAGSKVTLTPKFSVSLRYTKVTDAGLEHLKGLAELQSLDLGITKITDAGLEHLKGLTGLQHLVLRETEVTDAGLEHLKDLTGLQNLELIDTEVTDAGLEHLKGLTELQYLDLGYTKITAAGLEHLKGLTGLHTLRLNDTEVTDAGLEHLKGLAGLRRLYLVGTKVTDAGVAKLRAALPECRVSASIR